MISSLSILTDYLVECLHKGKCKDYKSSLEHMTANDSLLAFRCMDCSKTFEKRLGGNLSKRFKNTSVL